MHGVISANLVFLAESRGYAVRPSESCESCGPLRRFFDVVILNEQLAHCVPSFARASCKMDNPSQRDYDKQVNYT